MDINKNNPSGFPHMLIHVSESNLILALLFGCS